MHELAICESLLLQVVAAACPIGTRQVGKITLRIGPLAGVEPDLVRRAFPLVAAGTPCAGAELVIDTIAVAVACRNCGVTSEVRANRLLCARCGTWRVKLVSGDEMRLDSIELLDAPPKELADV